MRGRRLFARWIVVLWLLVGAGAAAQTLSNGMTFRECTNCPEMVVIGAGEFTMGVAAGEVERERVPARFREDALPQHRVNVRQFALGRFAVTRSEFAAFV